LVLVTRPLMATIHLSVVVSLSPLIVEVGVGTSSDGENCTMGEKNIGLLWRLVDL
jgi:hypothetical protein